MATHSKTQRHIALPVAGGLITDLSPHLLPPGAWSDGHNIRSRNGLRRSPTALKLHEFTTCTDVMYFAQATKSGSIYLVFVGTDDAYSWGGGTESEITMTAGDFTGTRANRFTGGMLHGVLFLTNGVDAPVGWAGANLEALDWDSADTWADKGYFSYCMRPYKNQLVSLGWNDGATAYKQTVLWSHIADPNTLPATWDYSDYTNLAGFQPLAERDGDLVDGLVLRDSFMVYAQNAIYRMTFVPNDYQQIMSFENVSLAQGMLAKECAVEIDGRHIVLANDDVIIHDGQNIQSLVDKRIRRAIFANISSDYYERCLVVKNRAKEEVWVCVPSADSDGELDLAWVWNWRDDEWTSRDLPRNMTHMQAVVLPSGFGDDAWEDDAESWNDDTSAWGEGFYTPAAATMIACSTSYDSTKGTVLQIDGSYADVLGQAQGSSYATREGILLDGNATTRKVITEVVLTAEGGDVEVQVGASESANGAYTWTDAETWVCGTTRRIPFRSASGIYHAIKLTFADKEDSQVVSYMIGYRVGGLR